MKSVRSLVWLNIVTLLFLLVEVTQGYPLRKVDGYTSFIPFVLDVDGEDLNRFNEIHDLMSIALTDYTRLLHNKDKLQDSEDNYDDFTEFDTEELSGRSLIPYVESIGLDLKPWEDNLFESNYKGFRNADEDFIVNKKRSDVNDICQKGNAFGNWLSRLCNRRN